MLVTVDSRQPRNEPRRDLLVLPIAQLDPREAGACRRDRGGRPRARVADRRGAQRRLPRQAGQSAACSTRTAARPAKRVLLVGLGEEAEARRRRPSGARAARSGEARRRKAKTVAAIAVPRTPAP